VKRFLLPGTRYYSYGFCTGCGVSMPIKLPDIDRAFINVGTLDNTPSVEFSYHIFYGSKAIWFDTRDGRPRFDAYPPKDFRP